MKFFGAIVVALATLRESEAFVGGGGLARAGAPAGVVHQRRAAKTALDMANVVVEFTNSKKTVNAVVGTPLSQLCAKNGVKVKYSCKQGDCATCSINVDGRYVKACQGKVPASRRIVKIKA